MSYGIDIYHFDTKKLLLDSDWELDEADFPEISELDRVRFLSRIEKYGYQRRFENASKIDFVKVVNACPITATLFDAQIGISIPYWENCETAIAEAF